MKETTAIARSDGGPASLEQYTDEEIGALEAALGNGDLSKLSARQRLVWYNLRCQAAGLDPRTQPFQWIPVRGGGITLYPKPEAAHQLAQRHNLTVEFTRREMLPNEVLLVECMVVAPDGRRTRNVGLRSLKGLNPTDYANAYMATHTVAERRAIFAHCGLGNSEAAPEAGPGQTFQVDTATGEVIEESTPALPAAAEEQERRHAIARASKAYRGIGKDPKGADYAEDCRRANGGEAPRTAGEWWAVGDRFEEALSPPDDVEAEPVDPFAEGAEVKEQPTLMAVQAGEQGTYTGLIR